MKNKSRYDAIFVDIDLATEPSEMSKLEALDWLETFIEDCKSRCESLREEIKIQEEIKDE